MPMEVEVSAVKMIIITRDDSTKGELLPKLFE